MSIYDTPTVERKGADSPEVNPNVNEFGVDMSIYDTPEALDTGVAGPENIHNIIARINEGGSKHDMRKDIDPLLEDTGIDKTKGWFGRKFDKMGGVAGLSGLLAEAVKDSGEGGTGTQPEYIPQDPLRFYGAGDYGNWADVTGSESPQVGSAALTQGLAGFYNPRVNQLLQSIVPEGYDPY